VLLKGIDPNQSLLELPSALLKSANSDIPALIGSRMAQSSGLKQGDYVTVQWRDVNGAFDARQVRVAQVISTPVQEIDNGQIWLALDQLRTMTSMPNQATYVVVARNQGLGSPVSGWPFHSLDLLLHDVRTVVQAKTAGSGIFYVLLLFLAMLAIFDTQVLSIFRRRKEMGTLMALGMTRGQVIRLFTLEGALLGVLAALVGAVYGVPLLGYAAAKGWALPKLVDSYGFAVGNTLYPTYSLALILGTTLFVLVVTTIVSYMPTRRIAHLKPTDALRGRWS
jgi:ABC-type lipoprotein release transport system permease subunit